jgi:hypothetical protein
MKRSSPVAKHMAATNSAKLQEDGLDSICRSSVTCTFLRIHRLKLEVQTRRLLKTEILSSFTDVTGVDEQSDENTFDELAENNLTLDEDDEFEEKYMSQTTDKYYPSHLLAILRSLSPPCVLQQVMTASYAARGTHFWSSFINACSPLYCNYVKGAEEILPEE